MESPALNNLPPDDGEIEQLLRTCASLPSLPDAGFSARVVAALPSSAFASRRRFWFVVAGALAGIGVVVVRSETWSDWAAAWPQLVQAATAVVQVSLDPVMLAALTVSGLSVLYALQAGRLRSLF